MKILLVMDPGILVPPSGYGGIERIVEMLAKEYVALGHEVHLLVTTGSYVEGCIMHHFGKEGFPPKKLDALKAIPIAWKFLWIHRNDFDLIHSFGRLAYLLPLLHHRVVKIMSYQREITANNIQWINRLPNRNMLFTGCSKDLISKAYLPGRWRAIYNGTNFSFYRHTEKLTDNAPLIFLGRIEEIKGCHTAIKVALATNHALIIAGNISLLPHDVEYFKTKVEPYIDGNQIKYIGTVNDKQKNEWLGKCKALLFPIEWDEPFGIVMVEAMACGTPVVAFKRGSVDEVIEEGVTGYKVNTLEEMYDAVMKLKNIDRAVCRYKASLKFDMPVIASSYLQLLN